MPLFFMSGFSGSWCLSSLSPERRFPRHIVTLLAAKNAKLNLESGFTTARDLSSGGTADVDLRNAINEGIIPGAADGNSDGRCTLRSDRGRDAVTLADERARQQGTRIPT
jgi:hypothetical protein